ncbi:MAG: hypothetical protein P9G45_15155 [Candidatus Contendobacter sp.]|nr:hypothetical protein [Candidatus Contendobacter sp.]
MSHDHNPLIEVAAKASEVVALHRYNLLDKRTLDELMKAVDKMNAFYAAIHKDYEQQRLRKAV